MLTRPFLIGYAFSSAPAWGRTHFWESDAFVGTDHDQHQQPFVAPERFGGATTYQVHCIACHATP